MDLEGIKKQILKGRTLEEVLEKIDWKEFENVVKDIFEKNDFLVKKNFRFKTKKRYEIDLVAVKNGLAFVVDCKHWRGGRYKKSGLISAAGKQAERLREFGKWLRKNLIARKMLKINETCSMIITLFEEDLITESRTVFVPVWKLNRFLSEQDILKSFETNKILI